YSVRLESSRLCLARSPTARNPLERNPAAPVLPRPVRNSPGGRRWQDHPAGRCRSQERRVNRLTIFNRREMELSSLPPGFETWEPGWTAPGSDSGPGAPGRRVSPWSCACLDSDAQEWSVPYDRAAPAWREREWRSNVGGLVNGIDSTSRGS